MAEAGTGEEALARLAGSVPDLLLLDLVLPGIDGFGVLRRLRADKRFLNLPVLVTTARDLGPGEKEFITRRLATLVRKHDASIAQLKQAVLEILQECAEKSVAMVAGSRA